MTNLKSIQSTFSSKSFLTPQQSICIKGGDGATVVVIPTPPCESEADGEGEVLRRKRKA